MLWITATAKALPDPSSINEVTSTKNIVGISSQIITNALISVSKKNQFLSAGFVKNFKLRQFLFIYDFNTIYLISNYLAYLRLKLIQLQIMSSHLSVTQRFCLFLAMEVRERHEKKYFEFWNNQMMLMKARNYFLI